MKLGLQIPTYEWATSPASLGDDLGAIARAAEEAGFASISVADHLLQAPMVAPPETEMLEAYSTLAFVAAHTRRVELLTIVTGVTLRHPGVLAKTVTTLDVLSGGRARLGIGASWYEREQVGLGVPVVPLPERFERLEETLQICLQMWSDDNGPFAGRHYRLAETLCVPAPVTRPHPPLLVGGGGEKRTLRLVARYADACNLVGSGPAEVGRKLEVLRAHCEAEGRDYDRIDKTVLAVMPALADVEAFVAAAAEYAALGVTELQVMPDRHPVRFAEQVAEQVLPRLAGIG